MTERQMFDRSFMRPKSFWKLSERQQWEIDNELGILDWRGDGLSEADMQEYVEYYD